jgi:hypothetical protein
MLSHQSYVEASEPCRHSSRGPCPGASTQAKCRHKLSRPHISSQPLMGPVETPIASPGRGGLLSRLNPRALARERMRGSSTRVLMRCVSSASRAQAVHCRLSSQWPFNLFSPCVWPHASPVSLQASPFSGIQVRQTLSVLMLVDPISQLDMACTYFAFSSWS